MPLFCNGTSLKKKHNWPRENMNPRRRRQLASMLPFRPSGMPKKGSIKPRVKQHVLPIRPMLILTS